MDFAERRPQPIRELKEVTLDSDPSHTTKISGDLSQELEYKLTAFLRLNADLLAWIPADMPGIDPDFICHSLVIDSRSKPIIQKKRKMGEERREVVRTETKSLLQAEFIREIQYTTWLANVVLVNNASRKWRMCTDYTDLNKACPKDSYPLPNIDQLVDNGSRFQYLSFMDAYSGYNQIRMNPRDEDKTAFIGDTSNFCYKVMPFGLKNVGATYQRLMDRVFKDHIRRNVEVYVDDMVAKTKTGNYHVEDLNQIFQ
jgi:hypothetical protein